MLTQNEDNYKYTVVKLLFKLKAFALIFMVGDKVIKLKNVQL